MATAKRSWTLQREEMLRWAAGIGAVTAEALALLEATRIASARARLLAARRAGLLASHRPLASQPALYTLTRQGLHMARLHGLEPARVSNANAAHLIACAAVAAGLPRCYPDHEVVGERELRRRERDHGSRLYSALLAGADDEQRLHRPDLVLCPIASQSALPVAVEVELAVKAPQRLVGICTAWARCRHVAGVLYLAAADVEAALWRAVERADAHAKVVVVPLQSLPCRLSDL